MPSASEPIGPADRIASLASAYEAEVIGRAGGRLTLNVAVRLSDGRVAPFRLHVEATCPVVLVREDKPDRLPAECYERHIVPDGWFCMNFPTADPLDVVDEPSAARWWITLLGYLRRQERAARTGRWPGKAWAHGAAADAQWAVERAAAGLGKAFVSALALGRLTAVASKGGSGPFLQLRMNGHRLYSVWSAAGRVATLRQPCPCGSGVALASCGEHREHAAQLALGLARQEAEEARFWRSMAAKTCCGTMKSCPLKLVQPSNDADADACAAAA